MNKIVVTGWVRCGNRWLARLLMSYADNFQNEADKAFTERYYWESKISVTYFGRPVEIQVSHLAANAYRKIGKNTYIIHTKRDPRDVFVSWYYLLLQGDEPLPIEKRMWKDYLPWLLEQQHHPYRKYVESWLALKEESPPRFIWTRHEYARDHKVQELLRFMDSMGIEGDLARAERAAKVLEMESDRTAYKIPGTSKRGVSGTWKQHFDKEDAQLIEQAFGDLIVKLGYDDLEWRVLLGEPLPVEQKQEVPATLGLAYQTERIG